MKPSIGRIVTYHNPGSADRIVPPSDVPAIIQAVLPDGTLRLHIFQATGHEIREGAEEGHGPGNWSWPVKV